MKSGRMIIAILAHVVTLAGALGLCVSPALADSLSQPATVHMTQSVRSSNVYWGNVSYVTIVWDPVPGATSYHLRVDTSPQFQWGVEETDLNTNSAVIPIVTNPNFAMPGQYYSELEDITVTAQNAGTSSPPAHVQLVGYPDGHVQLGDQMIWTAWTGAGAWEPPFNQATFGVNGAQNINAKNGISWGTVMNWSFCFGNFDGACIRF